MKPKMKKTLKVFLIVVSVILLLLVCSKYWLGAAIKSTVNGVGPSVLGVPVNVENVSVDLFGGKVRMNDLVIGNPEGFDSEYLFKMDSLSLDIATFELFKGDVHIYDITVLGPHIIYHKKLTTSNLDKFLNILEEKYPPSPKEEEPSEDKVVKDASAKPVVIDHFLLDEGTITVKIGVPIKVPLLQVELNDLGKDGSLMGFQIVRILVKSIFSSVFSAVTGVAGLGVDVVKGTGSAVVSGVTGAVKGIGSIFSSNDDEKKDEAKAEEGNKEKSDE